MADQVVVEQSKIGDIGYLRRLPGRPDADLHVESREPHLRRDDLRPGGRVRSQVVEDRHEISVNLRLLGKSDRLLRDGQRPLRKEHVTVHRMEEETVELIQDPGPILFENEVSRVDKLALRLRQRRRFRQRRDQQQGKKPKRNA